MDPGSAQILRICLSGMTRKGVNGDWSYGEARCGVLPSPASIGGLRQAITS